MIARLLAALVFALPLSAATLTFDQALARAYETHRVDAAPEGLEWPTMRVEAAWSDVRRVDIVHDSLLVHVDYPLLDGGSAALHRQTSELAFAKYRERIHDETVDAFARLYLAQERGRILQAGLDRARSMLARATDLRLTHEISNVTAAQWQDEAIAAEAQVLDVELARVEAEARLRQLVGGEIGEVELPIAALTNLTPPATEPLREPSVLALEAVRAARKPQLLLSAFGGVASLPGDSRSALFGMRLTLGLPMFDAALRRREAEARLEVASSELNRAPEVDRDLLAQRIALLARAVEVAKERVASVARLTSAGLRSESTLAGVTLDVARRESALLEARVELWRVTQKARR